jgi:hypothetical protein
MELLAVEMESNQSRRYESHFEDLEGLLVNKADNEGALEPHRQ